MAKKRSAIPQPFQYRGKWRIQVTLDNGQRPSKDFESFEEAKSWGIEMLANGNNQHEPVLGGPTRATLAQALDHYARNFSVRKGGVHAELNRINHYLEAAGMPLLKAYPTPSGGVEVKAVEPKDTADTRCRKNVRKLEEYVQERRAKRAQTYACIARLANMRCGQISPADMEEFVTVMGIEGLSPSTIQKEIAMLKTFFNSSTRLNWKAVENPCVGIKLGKHQRRFVHLSNEQRESLIDALAACENPYFWPLVMAAKESTLRLDTLVNMTWENVSVEERTAVLKTKTGQKVVKLSKEVQKMLADLPKSPSGQVFPMTKSAINSAWERVRNAAGLPKLQFRDLRHLGATDWVRRGLNAYDLRQVMGHCHISTAQNYVDMVGTDFEKALDKASARGGVMHLPPEPPSDPDKHMRMKRAERFKKAVAKAMEEQPDKNPHRQGASQDDRPRLLAADASDTPANSVGANDSAQRPISKGGTVHDIQDYVRKVA
jgi:site-specific recombinase XerD